MHAIAEPLSYIETVYQNGRHDFELLGDVGDVMAERFYRRAVQLVGIDKAHVLRVSDGRQWSPPKIQGWIP